MTSRLHPLLMAALVFGCGRAEPAADTTASSPTPVATATTAAAPAGERCPATGLWSQCAIVERLERSGLAPRVDSTATPTEPPLTAKGFLVRVGRADLEVYLYPDAASRERDQARLDRAKYVEYAAPVAMENQATLIASGNALAVLHSRNDHQRERVGDAITAGAPAKSP